MYEDAESIHLILELCRGGDWFERLLSGGTFSEEQAALATQSVLKTLSYCHSLGVIHRRVYLLDAGFTRRERKLGEREPGEQELLSGREGKHYPEPICWSANSKRRVGSVGVCFGAKAF